MISSDAPTSSTTIVVPCYNERKRLQLDSFRDFAAESPQVKFLFVDDGSTDDTSGFLAPLCESSPDTFQLLKLAANGGKAEAVRAGFMKAFDSQPEFVGFWDADLSTPLDELPDMLAIFRERPVVDMVFGARVNLLGRSVRRKLMRHYIGRVFATFVAQLLGLPIYDTQCGAKVFRVNDRLVEIFQEPFLSRWIFDVEIIARAAQLQASDDPPLADTIVEQPLRRWFDVAGSKIKLRDFVVVSGDLVRIYFNNIRPAR